MQNPLLLVLACLSGVTWNVPIDCENIQEAIDASEDGDVVLVSPSVWKEHLSVTNKTISFVGFDVSVAPSEYVIIRKLEYFKEGGSSKHLRDIYGLVKIDDEINLDWLRKEIENRNLKDVWEQVDP